MLGAAMLYVALYASNNTQQEDMADYVKAARRMIAIVMEQSRNGTFDPSDDLQQKSRGIKVLIGACTLVTRYHVTGATISSSIIRNGSRFEFSHKFCGIMVNQLCDIDNNISDYVLHSVQTNNDKEDGTTTKVWTSRISDYLNRPSKNAIIDTMCIYDFYSKILTCNKSCTRKDKINFEKNHPSKGAKVCSLRKEAVIPTLMYFNLPTSKDFGDISILDTSITLDEEDEKFKKMEEYAKKCCILFCPFRSLDDIKIENSHLKYFQKKIAGNKIKSEHLKIMKNIQDCHNAMATGTPDDILEQVTKKKINDSTNNKNKKSNNSEATVGTEIIELIKDWMMAMEILDPQCKNSCKDSENILQMESSVVTDLGINECGKKFVAIPKLDFLNGMSDTQKKCFSQ